MSQIKCTNMCSLGAAHVCAFDFVLYAPGIMDPWSMYIYIRHRAFRHVRACSSHLCYCFAILCLVWMSCLDVGCLVWICLKGPPPQSPFSLLVSQTPFC